MRSDVKDIVKEMFAWGEGKEEARVVWQELGMMVLPSPCSIGVHSMITRQKKDPYPIRTPQRCM